MTVYIRAGPELRKWDVRHVSFSFMESGEISTIQGFMAADHSSCPTKKEFVRQWRGEAANDGKSALQRLPAGWQPSSCILVEQRRPVPDCAESWGDTLWFF